MITNIFTSTDDKDLERKVNEFLHDWPHAKLISSTYYVNCLHDRFYDGNIANQWIEKAMIIIIEP